MTRIVVDASVLVASAMADGRTRRTIQSLTRVGLFAPSRIDEELRRQAGRIARHSGLESAIVGALFEDLLSRVTIVPVRGYAASLDRASTLAKRAGAFGDEDYIALALALNAPVWTYDRDFERVTGISTIDRAGVEMLDRRT